MATAPTMNTKKGRKMRLDELSEEQKLELKQRILEDRNEHLGEGTSYGELADADELVSDEDARDWAEGMEFSPDDFSCSAGKVFEVRVTWPVGKTYRVPADSKEEAVAKMKQKVDAGEICVWTDGFEAGDDVTVEAVEES